VPAHQFNYRVLVLNILDPRASLSGLALATHSIGVLLLIQATRRYDYFACWAAMGGSWCSFSRIFAPDNGPPKTALI